jgi:hypothetical protein
MVEAAVISVVSFVAGIVFRHAWPLFVAWQDRKLLKPSFAGKLVAVDDLKVKANFQVEAKPQDPHRRRVGLAEARSRAEFESLKPVEHQAKVTANNIAALEGK